MRGYGKSQGGELLENRGTYELAGKYVWGGQRMGRGRSGLEGMCSQIMLERTFAASQS